MNNTFYFPHDYDAANDDKVLQMRSEKGLVGYALFWLCLETMAKNENGYIMTTLLGGLSIGYGTTKEELKVFIDYCVGIGLFCLDQNGFFSPRMMEHKNFRKTLSINGKQGADKRWKNSPPIRPPIDTPNA